MPTFMYPAAVTSMRRFQILLKMERSRASGFLPPGSLTSGASSSEKSSKPVNKRVKCAPEPDRWGQELHSRLLLCCFEFLDSAEAAVVQRACTRWRLPLVLENKFFKQRY